MIAKLHHLSKRESGKNPLSYQTKPTHKQERIQTMTKYYYETMNGKRCGLHEKRVSLLINKLWQAIRADNITLVRFPDGLSDDDLENNRQGFDYAVYTHGKDSSNLDIVIRYYVSIADEGRYSTDPIELSYSTFLNDLLTYGDSLIIEDSKTGEALKTFAIIRGA